MSDLLARRLLAALQPVGLALARWRFASLDRRHQRLVARLLTRRRYSWLVEIYAIPTIPAQQPANYVQTTLAAGVTNVATDWPLTSVAGLPVTGNFMLRCDDALPATTFEIVECTAVNVGTGHVTVTRGQENTAGIAHLAGAFVGNDITTGMLLRLFPWGMLNYAEITANFGSFSALTDLTGLAVTVTVGANRRIRIKAQVRVFSSVASDYAQVNIQEGATNLQSAEMSTGTVASRAPTIVVEAILVPTAGAHTYKLTGQRSAGTGLLTVFAVATNTCFIEAEDIGPA